jgi:hypothetical protein
MKTLIRLEELAMFILSIFLMARLSIHFSWWLYILLFFSPDIGVLGYLFNASIGAVTYNLFHHKALAIGFYIAGIIIQNEYLQFTGLLLFGHSSFDRVLDYGLKYSDSFKHTHLGMLPEKRRATAL